MTWGSIRPVILLPAEAETWPIARCRDVLLHELAHVQRYDCLTQAIAQVACAAFWFNPLAWFAAARMRIERERACDDRVLGTGSRPSDYAVHLLAMVRELRSGRAAAIAAVAMARPSQLEGRLHAILDPHRHRRGVSRLGKVLASLGLASLLLPLAAVRLQAQVAQQPKEGSLVKAPHTDNEKTMTVSGRVTDPEGKPLAKAMVEVIGRPRKRWVGADVSSDRHELLGRGESDADGTFRLDVPRTSSLLYFDVYVLASQAGFGLGWVSLNPDAPQPTAEVRLPAQQVLGGRLIDINGQPASGVKLEVTSLGSATDRGTYEGIYTGNSPPQGVQGWPSSVRTDEQGRFRFTGIANNLTTVILEANDIRYARTGLYIKTTSPSSSENLVLTLEPAKIIAGRVSAADTGKPIPKAVIAAGARIQNEHSNGIFTIKFQADGEGRFRINPRSSEHYYLDVFPTAGEPYLISHEELNWVKGTQTLDRDFKLKRGVPIRGKIHEEGSGRPLRDCSVQFLPAQSRDNDRILSGWQAIVASDDQGSFEIVVPPGKGYLLIFGPTSDYVLEMIGSRMLYRGTPGGMRYYAHKFIPYSVTAESAPPELAVALHPGKTIKGRVVGPEGQQVTKAFVITTLRIEPFNPSWRGDYQIPVRDGRFELHGLGPEATTRIWILDPDHQWGATVDISGKQANDELKLTLQPCGQAKARFVGPDGQPVPKFRALLDFVATPGPHRLTLDKKEQDKLAADMGFVANIDRKHYWGGPSTGDDGRVTFPALIPGALYRISEYLPDQGPQIRKDFSVKPGETLDLGDILIATPSE
jgi:protocatechuate 3,4-dioxygenase beta subunit